MIPQMEGSDIAGFPKRSRISSKCFRLEVEKDDRAGGRKGKEGRIGEEGRLERHRDTQTQRINRNQR